MQKDTPISTGATGNLASYFVKADAPTQQETLGKIVAEILLSGRTLNRKSLCMSLLARVDKALSPQEEKHYHELIGLLFRE